MIFGIHKLLTQIIFVFATFWAITAQNTKNLSVFPLKSTKQFHKMGLGTFALDI